MSENVTERARPPSRPALRHSYAMSWCPSSTTLVWARMDPSDELVIELRDLARRAQVLTPHILADGSHLTQRETAVVLRASGLSPLGPVAVNTAAPDEGNMYLIGKVGSPEHKARFLAPLVAGTARSAFFMSEPAADGGAGSDPSMMQTTARRDGEHWVINGRKAFITGRARRYNRHRDGEVNGRGMHVPARVAESCDSHRARDGHPR